MKTLLLFMSILNVFLCEPICPQYSLPFDYQSCDHRIRSQCPSGFTCRKGFDNKRPEESMYLCCENVNMTIKEWFSEAEIAPQVFPQSPLFHIKSTRLRPIDDTTSFPNIAIGDELALLPFETFVVGYIQQIDLYQNIQMPFVHILTIIDGGFHPFAMFFSYNIQSNGGRVIAVGDTTPSTTYIDNSTTVPQRDSYRAQYVVLVYQTQQPIQPTQNAGVQGLSVDLLSGCEDITCFLTNSTVGRQLGQPLAGTLFYMTTRRSLFSVSSADPPQQSKYKNSITPTMLIIVFIVTFTLQ